jgi:hypothetical protein
LYSVVKYSVPIPIALAAMTTTLPAVAALVMESLRSLQSSSTGRSSTRSPSFTHNAVLAAFLIIETILATLAGTHAYPASALDCGLQSRWQTLFRAKDERHIRAIQDRFDCCGLRSTSDMPWPFPAQDVPKERCVERFDRSRSCLEDWRGQEQNVAGVILAVNVLVMLWQAVVVHGIRPDVNWAINWMGGRLTDERGSRRAIEVGDEEERYLDEPETGVDQDLSNERGDARLIEDEGTRGTHAYRVQPSQLREA